MSDPRNSPLVSVIIPLHNRADKIADAVASVLSQSMQDFEIIVVDDGSTDNGPEILAALADPRIICIRQPKSGANVARNRGIDSASGLYVAMLDSDDVFLAGHLERSIQALLQAPDALVYARVIVDRGNGRTFLKPPRPPRKGENISDYVMTDTGFVQTSTVVIATQSARTVRYLDWLQCAQDTDFAVRVAASGVPLIMLEEPGAIWNDASSGARISAMPRPEHLMKWLDFIEPLATRRAITGYRGWHIGRALALRGEKLKALGYFSIAVIGGCYRPAIAPRILGQILLAGPGYRALVNGLLGLKSRLRPPSLEDGGLKQ